MLILSIFFLVFGVYFTYFGFKLLFQKGYVEKLREKNKQSDGKWFTEKEGYFYDKYVWGVRSLIMGLLIFAAGAGGLLIYFDLI